MAKGKAGLHQRNVHANGYDFEVLVESNPGLKAFLITNKQGQVSLNFHDSAAVKALNQALLMYHYDLEHWDIPKQYLCPAVPGRADYIHHLADLLASTNRGKVPRGAQIRCLDIGTGANLVYPIIGSKAYGWSFVGTEVDKTALAAAQKIIDQNKRLAPQVSLRPQPNSKAILRGTMQVGEYFDVVCCNPPFYGSSQEASAANHRKRKGLGAPAKAQRNFGGQANELWYPGGEKAFIQQLIRESAETPTQCYWYTSLVAKEQHLKVLQPALKKAGSTDSKVIPMTQGNKNSRILAWTFLKDKQRKAWEGARWQ